MKALLKIVILLVILAVAVAVFLYTNLDRVVKTAVEEGGPRFTGTPVQLDSVHLSPLSGEGSLEGLSVGNPQGYSAPNAFTLGTVDLALETASLTENTVVIDRLHIIDPEITFEGSKSSNNLKALQENLRQVAGGGEAPADSEEAGAGKKIIIRDFSLTGGKVHYANKLLGDKTLKLDLPEIRLNGIGEKSQGVTAAEAGEQILGEIYRQVSVALANSDAVKDLGQEYEDKFKEKKDELKDTFDNLKGLFDR